MTWTSFREIREWRRVCAGLHPVRYPRVRNPPIVRVSDPAAASAGRLGRRQCGPDGVRGRRGPRLAERAGRRPPAGRTRPRPAAPAWPRAPTGRSRRARPAPRRPGGRRRAGRRPAPPARWPGRRPRGAPPRSGPAGPPRSARSRAPGSRRPSAIASKRWRSTAGSRSRLGDLPDGDAVLVLRPGPRGAHGDPLEREHRRGVGEQPDPVGRDHGHPGAVPRRLDRDRHLAPARRPGDLDLVRRRSPGRATPVSSAARTAAGQVAAPARPARSTRPAAEAARASASVSASSSVERLGAARAGRRPASTVAGSSGSRVVAVSASSRCRRTSSATRSTASGVEAHPGRDRAGRSARRRRCARSGRPCRCRAAARRPSGRRGGATCADQRRGLDAGLHDVPVDGEAVDRRGVRQQPDPLPLGQDRRRARRSPRGSPRPAAARGPEASSRTSSRRASARPRVGQRRRTRGPAGPRSAGASTASRSAAAAQARSSSAGSSAGPGAARRARPRRRPARRPAPAASAPGRRAPRPSAGRASTSSTRRQVSRDRWVIRRPSSRTCTCAARASAQRRGRSASVGPQLGRDPVGGPPGDVLHHVADVEQRQPAALELGVRDVDQPGGHQRLEHGRVAQPALGLLEVGHRQVRELADQLVARAHQVAAAPAAARGRRGASCASIVARSRRVRLGSPARWRRSSRPRATRRSPSAGVEHLGQRAHRVVELGAGVPQRVPDLLGQLAPTSTPSSCDQHDVEVGVRRQLAAAVAADRHQRDAGVGPAARGVRRGAERSASAVRGHARSRSRLPEVGCWLRSAASSRSPVRTRTTDSTGVDPDLAVADPAGLGAADDGVDDRVDVGVGRPRSRCGSWAPARCRTPRRGRPRCGPSGGRSR